MEILLSQQISDKSNKIFSSYSIIRIIRMSKPKLSDLLRGKYSDDYVKLHANLRMPNSSIVVSKLVANRGFETCEVKMLLKNGEHEMTFVKIRHCSQRVNGNIPDEERSLMFELIDEVMEEVETVGLCGCGNFNRMSRWFHAGLPFSPFPYSNGSICNECMEVRIENDYNRNFVKSANKS
jgi:hypothetical protein